jgi:hypothetical protein
MNKQEREQLRDYKLIELIKKTEAINNIAIKAEPFVKEYWRVLKDLWTRPVGYNEAKQIKNHLADGGDLRMLNKEYRELLK